MTREELKRLSDVSDRGRKLVEQSALLLRETEEIEVRGLQLLRATGLAVLFDDRDLQREVCDALRPIVIGVLRGKLADIERRLAHLRLAPEWAAAHDGATHCPDF